MDTFTCTNVHPMLQVDMQLSRPFCKWILGMNDAFTLEDLQVQLFCLLIPSPCIHKTIFNVDTLVTRISPPPYTGCRSRVCIFLRLLTQACSFSGTTICELLGIVPIQSLPVLVISSINLIDYFNEISTVIFICMYVGIRGDIASCGIFESQFHIARL